MRRRAVFVAGALMLLAGCDSSGTPTGEGASDSPFFTDADVTFARGMLVLNAQSRRIARCAHGRSVPSALRTLAAAIDSTERDEDRTLTVWLRSWGRSRSPAPSGSDTATVGRLTAARDKDFEALFRQALADTQRRQIAVARRESRHGINPGARSLAGRITRSRTAELHRLDHDT